MKANAASASPGAGVLRWLALLAALLAGACGFQPRGAASLPPAMAITYIAGYDTLTDDFREALESHGARVTQNRAEATAVLTVTENKAGTDVLSVDLSGKVLEYRLHQTIRFEVTAADGHMLVDPQSVTLSRAMKFNVNGVLGSEREGEAIRRALQRDVVNLAMLRITAAGKR
jgi:LPS-assembly lipoprotein